MSEGFIVVTGASTGIGLATVKRCLQEGYQVIATARQRYDLDALSTMGAITVEMDASSPESVYHASHEILARTQGDIEAVFLNAGYGQPGAVEDLSVLAMQEQFQVNLFSVHQLTRSLIPSMIERGKGKVIVNSSVLGLVAMPMRGAYVASKFALQGWSDTLRLELASTGITVTAIQPGPILTRFKQNAYTAFKRHIEPSGSRHQLAYEKLENRLQSHYPPFGALEAERVANLVLKIIQKRRPKDSYRITIHTHTFAFLRRLLPSRMLNTILGTAS